MSTEIRVFLAERLREERERLGLSQAEMAQRGGTKTRTYQDWERGLATVSTEFLVMAASQSPFDVMYVLSGVRQHGQSGESSQKVSPPIVQPELDADVGERIGEGWQTVEGVVDGWIDSSTLKGWVDSQKISSVLGIRWVEERAKADFAVYSDSSFERTVVTPFRSPYSMSATQFWDLLASRKLSGQPIRESLWAWFFKGQSPFDRGAVCRFLFKRNAHNEIRLFRVDRVEQNSWSKALFLVGHWESDGEPDDVPLSAVQSDIRHIGSGRTFQAADYAEMFKEKQELRAQGIAAETGCIREVSPEQAALLDNYENADEEGRDAARRVLVALSKSKTSKKAA